MAVNAITVFAMIPSRDDTVYNSRSEYKPSAAQMERQSIRRSLLRFISLNSQILQRLSTNFPCGIKGWANCEIHSQVSQFGAAYNTYKCLPVAAFKDMISCRFVPYGVRRRSVRTCSQLVHVSPCSSLMQTRTSRLTPIVLHIGNLCFSHEAVTPRRVAEPVPYYAVSVCLCSLCRCPCLPTRSHIGQVKSPNDRRYGHSPRTCR